MKTFNCQKAFEEKNIHKLDDMNLKGKRRRGDIVMICRKCDVVECDASIPCRLWWKRDHEGRIILVKAGR